MANGQTAHEHVGAVRAQSLALEVSPSKSSPQSPIAHGGSKATGHGASDHTKPFAGHGNMTRGKHRGTKTHIGKKNHMHQKSSGR